MRLVCRRKHVVGWNVHARPAGRLAPRHRSAGVATVKPTPDVLIFIVGIVTGAVTLAGGGVALRLRGMLSLLLGLSSGAIMGVALFDLIPEALNLAGEAN